MRIIELAHLHLTPALQPGGQALDATAGRGHDCLYLAQGLGEGGMVHAFDIQKEALTATQERLEAAGLKHRLQCHHANHADIEQYLAPASLCAIMFNLGYLPGSDHAVRTQTKSTLQALQAALRLLAPKGRMTVMVYPGHEGGEQEAQEIAAFFADIPLLRASVLHTRCHNGASNAPQLFSLEMK